MMDTNGKLKRNENGKDVEVKKYRCKVGSLLYITASRSDIMFIVCMCARYQLPLKKSHLKPIKCIFRYLHGTLNYGLWYSKGSDCSLVGYTDSDFSGCKSDRKSTSGTCHIFSNSLVSWHSKKQVSIALSTADAEYMAVGSCCLKFCGLNNNYLILI